LRPWATKRRDASSDESPSEEVSSLLDRSAIERDQYGSWIDMVPSAFDAGRGLSEATAPLAPESLAGEVPERQ
jgi:hypothetical protein